MAVLVEAEGAANHAPEALQCAEAIDHRWSLIAATDHAVGALGVAAGHAVVFPLGAFQQFLVTVGVALLKQIAGPLPSEDVIGGHAPGNAIVVALAHEEFKEQGRHVEFPSGLAIGQNGAKETAHTGAAHEAILIRSFVVAVTRREHDALDAHAHHFVEECADTVGLGPVEECCVRGDAEAALDSLLNARDSDIVGSLAANGKVVVLAQAVEMYAEGEVLGRGKFRQAAFEIQRVGAEVDVLLARHQPLDDFDNLGMQQRLATGDGNHGRAAFVYSGKALLGSKLLLEDVGRILHLAASGAGQAATKERLKHQNQRVALDAGELLVQHISRDRPHLGDGNCHI